ncbi:MAG: hypothetical protein LBD44_01760 [Spirochaetaceae bacterium]|jgi:hypothetical protein|nr:hypothetical protein [Spirochaetaceae bacterium]
MKRMNFGFGFGLGAVLCAAAFLLFGCEDALNAAKEYISSAKIETPVKTVSVTKNEAEFLNAVNSAQIETIEIESGFDVDEPLTVSSKKTLVIPIGVTLAVKSITVNADVDVTPYTKEETTGKSGVSLGLRLSSAGEDVGLLVKEKFVIAEGVNFTMHEGRHLVFADKNVEARIDGVFNIPDETSVYHNDEDKTPLVLTGNGKVKVGSSETKAIADSGVDGFKVPPARAADEESGGDEEGEEGEEGEPGEGGEHLPAIDGDVQLLKVGAGGETEEVDGTYEDNLNSVLAWINENCRAGDEYIIRLAADQAINMYGFPRCTIDGDTSKTGIKITLEGHEKERKITWLNDGTDTKESVAESLYGLFTIINDGTLTLGNNITIDMDNKKIELPSTAAPGTFTSAYSIISVGILPGVLLDEKHTRGRFVMKDGSMITNVDVSITSITAGKAPEGAPVWIRSHSRFDMEGGKITGNTCTTAGNTGCMVYIYGTKDSEPRFVMSGNAEISGNTNSIGVYVYNAALTMNGGTISNNGSWGVYNCGKTAASVFTMNGGTIDSGKSGGGGGAVYLLNSNTFTMNGGTITGNSDNFKGIYLTTSLAAFIINGTVAIDVPVQCMGSSAAPSTIYIGSGFKSNTPIQIDLFGSEATILKTWESAVALLFLKGGTPADTTGISTEILGKFTGRKGYTSGSASKELDGTITLSFNETNEWGYAQFTAAP